MPVPPKWNGMFFLLQVIVSFDTKERGSYHSETCFIEDKVNFVEGGAQ